MTEERSRRAVLAGVGGSLVALTGCSALPGGDGSRSYDRERLGRVLDDTSLPDRAEFPFPVPQAQLQAHRDRIRTQIDAVPAKPSVPNEAIAREIRERRETLSERLKSIEEERPAYRRLATLRDIRGQAGELRGLSLAATDAIERRQITEQRDDLRDRLAAFRAAWDYRGDGPVDAVAANAELEALLDRAVHELEPWPLFPDSAVAVPERVGYIAGKLEAAAAVIDDAEQFRNRLANRSTGRYRSALMATATWLRRRTRDQAARFESVLAADTLPVDRDAVDSPADHLHNLAAETARNYTNDELLDRIGEGGYADAVRYAAQRRTALRALSTVSRQIGVGEGDAAPSVPSDPSLGEIANARERAIQAYRNATDSGVDPVATLTITPAYTELSQADLDVENGTDRGYALFAQYWYVEKYARATAEITGEVTHLLRSAAE
ncbi:hypothetical protein [Haloarcula montana]|uniref:hypothetical protein n=1 Tax=Haloarcula montana TaxID=3111776 RepID=UPI002D78513C|nr:hypothetical protein [Haloarcula sp. GH36]